MEYHQRWIASGPHAAPVVAGQRYVAALGGSAAVLARMREAMDKGDYRWAAQLGYQSEAATWRNMYLEGAQEVRNGMPKLPERATVDLVRGATPAMFFEYLSVRLDVEKARGHDMRVNWRFDDLDQDFALILRNGVLTRRDGARHAPVDLLSVRMTKAVLDRISLRQLDFGTAVRQGDIRVKGDASKLTQLLGMQSCFQSGFNIVTPRGLRHVDTSAPVTSRSSSSFRLS